MRFPRFYALLLIVLSIHLNPTFLFAQEEEKKSIKQTLSLYHNMVADWLSLYAATYAGENNAVVHNFQNQLLSKGEEALQDHGLEGDASEIKTLLNEITDGGQNETTISEFLNATGLKVYLIGKLEGYEGNSVAELMNKISAAKYTEKNGPYIEVQISQKRDTTNGNYTLSAQITPSQAISFEKFEFGHPLSDFLGKYFEESYANRSEARMHLKEVLETGLTELQAEIGGAFLPPLRLSVEGKHYRPGDLVQVSGEPEATIEVKAIGKNSVARKVNWEALPSNKTVIVNDSVLVLQTDLGGTWEVMANAKNNPENDNANISVRVIQVPLTFNEILKLIVRETLNEARERSAARKARESERQDSLQQTIDELYAEIYQPPVTDLSASTDSTVEYTSTFMEEEGEWLSEDEVESLLEEEHIRSYLQAHKHHMVSLSDFLLELKIEEFLISLIDDKGNFDRFITRMEEDAAAQLGSYIGKSILGAEREGLKTVVVNYVNTKIEEIADEKE